MTAAAVSDFLFGLPMWVVIAVIVVYPFFVLVVARFCAIGREGIARYDEEAREDSLLLVPREWERSSHVD